MQEIFLLGHILSISEANLSSSVPQYPQNISGSVIRFMKPKVQIVYNPFLRSTVAVVHPPLVLEQPMIQPTNFFLVTSDHAIKLDLVGLAESKISRNCSVF
jgi:hypothetical protein